MRKFIRKANRSLTAASIISCTIAGMGFVSAGGQLVFPVPSFAQDVASPKAQFPDPIFDFGSVSEGTKVSHDFTVTNGGAAPLVIQRLVPACGCTASSASRDTIPAGESAVIHVEFDTTGFSGNRTKEVRVFTNDSSQMSATLALRGNVVPDLEVAPRRVSFEEVIHGQKDSPRQEVTIAVRSGSGLSIDRIVSRAPFVSVQELHHDPLKKKFAVILDPMAPIGELRDRVMIDLLRDGKRTTINMPVYANIKGDFRVKPSTVSFGLIEPGAPLERSITVEFLGAKSGSVRSVESDSSALSSEVKEIKAGKIYVVKVILDPKRVSTDLRAQLTITAHSDHDEQSTVGVFGVLPPKLDAPR